VSTAKYVKRRKLKLDLSLRFEMGYRTAFDTPRSTEEYTKCLTFLLKAAMTRTLPCGTSHSRLAPVPYGFWTLRTPHTAEPIALNISSGLLMSQVTSLTEGYCLTRPCGLWELASRVNAKTNEVGARNHGNSSDNCAPLLSCRAGDKNRFQHIVGKNEDID
jgi:hypothetical protein